MVSAEVDGVFMDLEVYKFIIRLRNAGYASAEGMQGKLDASGFRSPGVKTIRYSVENPDCVRYHAYRVKKDG